MKAVIAAADNGIRFSIASNASRVLLGGCIALQPERRTTIKVFNILLDCAAHSSLRPRRPVLRGVAEIIMARIVYCIKPETYV